MVASICHPPADWSCLEQSQIDDLDPIKKERSEAYAWSLLASLTAYQIGVCPVVIRPCAARCAPAGSLPYAVVGGGLPSTPIGMFNPYISGGKWYNACGCGPRDCSCESLPTVLLPGPVGGIVSVSIDGVALPSSAYRVYGGNQLVRTDNQPWPACQDMATEEDAEGSFVVTYYRGSPPNIMTTYAAGVLAHEFYLSCDGGECRLPGNVVRASRGGESYEFEATDFPEGKTDIAEVNAVIRIYNPFGQRVPTTIVSPESLGVGGRVPTWRR